MRNRAGEGIVLPETREVMRSMIARLFTLWIVACPPVHGVGTESRSPELEIASRVDSRLEAGLGMFSQVEAETRTLADDDGSDQEEFEAILAQSWGRDPFAPTRTIARIAIPRSFTRPLDRSPILRC